MLSGRSGSLLRPDFSALRLNRWLFSQGSGRQLAALRIGLCALVALRLGGRTGFYLGLPDQPKALFRPLSFMKLFEQMPSRGVVLALLIVGIVSATLAAVGLKGRIALPIAWGCAVFLNGMVTSQGKVVHNDVLPLLCLFLLIPARHSDFWSLDSWLVRRRAGPDAPPPAEMSGDYGWPARAAMLVVCGVYFFTGVHKLQTSGLAWAAADNLRWVLYTASDAQGGNSFGLLLADHPLLTHLFAWGTLLVEVGFPIVLILPLMRWLMVPGVIGLHSGIYIAMGLNYWPWIATVVLVFVNWPTLAGWVRQWVHVRRAMRPAAAGT